MRDRVIKLWAEIFKVIGFGFFIGFIIGGFIGLQFIGSAEIATQIIAAFLSYAPAGGIIGATLAGCVILFVIGHAALKMNKAKRSQNNG